MSTITKQLQDLGIEKEQLSKSILNKIDHLEGMQEALQDTRKEYAEEQDPTVRQEMHDLIVKAEKSIDELESMIVDAIRAFSNKLNEEQSNNTVVNDEPNGEPAGKQVSRKPIGDETKKSSSGWKWILGGVVLLVTLGAVNTLNKE